MHREQDLKIANIIDEARRSLRTTRKKKEPDNRSKDVSLEEVMRDMANVFNGLKDGIVLVNSLPKSGSTYNIENEIEKVYKQQAEIKIKKQAQAIKKAPASTGSKQKKRNNDNSKSSISSKNYKKRSPTNSQRSRSSTPSRSISQDAHNKSHIVTNLPDTVRVRPSSARPNMATNENKATVTNVAFPKELKPNINANSSVQKSSNANARPSTTPSLRKASPAMHVNKVMSIPPTREVYNPLGILKDDVARAVKEHKTFTIKGQFPAVRRSLVKRGWIEKFHPNHREKMNDELRKYQQMDITVLVDLLRNRDLAETVKKLIKSKLLRDHQVDLYWDHSFDAFKECPDSKKLTLINKFRRESFSYTSKQGLCQAAREAHWLQIPGVARINHPRCFVLMKGGDTKTFLKDYGLTAAVSLLKWVVKNNVTLESKIVSASGKISMRFFNFAIAECYKYVKKQKHLDIDEEIPEAMEVEWNEFLEQFYKIVHVGNHFKLPDTSDHASQETNDMVRKSVYLLNKLREFMPYMDMDGYMNIWILKPINSSRGMGIHICRTLSYILETVRRNPNIRYVIQKYIERPFLIHDTKFDIRQWFLVSSAYPLTIWNYKLCYLRFSSQTYNLRKLHESIHLTNNSVQAKYLQYKVRDPLLTPYGMWNSDQFKSYLSDIGYPDIFEKVIYPGMKQCITGAMIAHLEKIDKRRNCFELYGADFILAENFEPWLLEINSNPALHASTPVTAKLCPEVLEDVIKVVVDHARNSRAGTGQFELVYREKIDVHFTGTKTQLALTGKPLAENYFCNIDAEEAPAKTSLTAVDKFGIPDPGKVLIQTSETMKKALKNLLELVKREKLKRHHKKEKSTEVKPWEDKTFSRTDSDVVSLFQSTAMSRNSSDHSVRLYDIESYEELSVDESKKITELFGEIKCLHQRKKVLSSLVDVVDTLKGARKKPA